MTDDTSHSSTFSVGELAERAGVSRRTVRYYVQRGLLDPPEGLGRGAFYRRDHLDRLLRIRDLQAAGVPLDGIAARLDGRGPPPPKPTPTLRKATPEPLWRRLALTDGVELHVRADALQHLTPDRLKTLLIHALEGDDS